MKVGEAMTRGVISIAPESLITKAAHMMLKYDVSGLPVINATLNNSPGCMIGAAGAA
jgi:CBS domain-containing protein